MNHMAPRPLDDVLAGGWKRVDPALKIAFAAAICVSVLAFGFEMTNLSMIHDDFSYIFLESPILGRFMGRFGFGWFHYYTQNAFLMPFLQMAQGIVFMALYGLVVARFWGARRPLDLALIASVVCVFPYMAQLYQFNVSMAPFPLAHLLAALAAVVSTRARPLPVLAAAVVYAAAFSIYQSVLANACTILGVWLLAQLLFSDLGAGETRRRLARQVLAAALALGAGGLLYVGTVHLLGLPIDDPRQAAGEAFRLSGALGSLEGIARVATGTRAFLLWPENYFPLYLKQLQLLFILAAALLCVVLPRSIPQKIAAVVMVLLVLLAPRVLQLLHPAGYYPNRALTAYALVIAGSIALVHRGGLPRVRNVSIVLAAVLLWGYLLQCNWISTVNYLNTFAHRAAFTQVLASLQSTGRDAWDGRNVVVVGRLDMSAEFPFRQSDGVASEFLDGIHMQEISRLMRTGVTFAADDGTDPRVREFAAWRRPWPHPQSVGVIEGTGVVVLSNDRYGDGASGAPAQAPYRR
jgi:hypothetical protein